MVAGVPASVSENEVMMEVTRKHSRAYVIGPGAVKVVGNNNAEFLHSVALKAFWREKTAWNALHQNATDYPCCIKLPHAASTYRILPGRRLTFGYMIEQRNSPA
jgi:hypothetical protein